MAAVHDERLQYCVSLIGCADFGALVCDRFADLPRSTVLKPALDALLTRCDASRNVHRLKDRHLFLLNGGKDSVGSLWVCFSWFKDSLHGQLVPATLNEAFVAAVRADGDGRGSIRFEVERKVAHQVTKAMWHKAIEYFDGK